jgi:hypothetical protein
VANVAGLFFVDPDVVDRSGSNIAYIDRSTPNPRHVVDVENISRVTRSAHVYASLPNGMARIEFLKPGATQPQPNWDDRASNIPRAARRRLECPLIRNGGPPGSNEPLQIDQIDDIQGTLTPSRHTTYNTRTLPISHTIDVR